MQQPNPVATCTALLRDVSEAARQLAVPVACLVVLHDGARRLRLCYARSGSSSRQ